MSEPKMRRGWSFWLAPEMIDTSNEQWKQADFSKGCVVFCNDVTPDAELNELLKLNATSFTAAAIVMGLMRGKLSVTAVAPANENCESMGTRIPVAPERDAWWAAFGPVGREAIMEMFNKVVMIDEEVKQKSRNSFRTTIG